MKSTPEIPRSRLRSHVLLLLVAAFSCGCAVAFAVPPDGDGFWRILDTETVGAREHIRKHPEQDGRGAVIAVLDTGVDMGAPGLQRTSEGKVKVIEARDFSGQGEVTLSEAKVKEIEGVRYLSTDAGKVRGFEALAGSVPDTAWRLGFFTEERMKNSEVDDVNLNGSKSDRFAVVAAVLDGKPAVFVDLDGDSDVADARRTRSYGEAQEHFFFPVPDPEHQRPPVTFALHVSDDGGTVTFHFDDGGHGTHVAGIAAGCGLMGRKGFDGIAPGAQILSLKIGDNTLSGGATTADSMHRAIEFAGEWSRDHATPVILNISYGIGSEVEGESDIDTALDAALERFPLLAASLSAGNEGPGMSSVGTPAAANHATAVAALLQRATAAALYGSRLDAPRIFSFSSRGGEVPKPDVLAPGVASSSVPAHDTGDLKGGTSMAAPQVTGAYALLASAARAQKLRFTGSTLKRALLHSARPIPGYGLVEQGAGVPDVGRALDALRKLSGRSEPFAVVGYEVETKVPTSVSGHGRAAYWRAGTYLPPEETGHVFTVSAVFPSEASAKERDAFQTLLSFRSEAPWIDVDRGHGRLVGTRSLDVRVTYDRGRLREPGVYSGRVLAVPDDGAGIAAFSLWTTVVVPYAPGASSGYALVRRDRSLEPGEVERHPVLVPPGATHLTVDVGTPLDRWGSTILYVFDPAGHDVPLAAWRASSEEGTRARAEIAGSTLRPGIWEIVTYGSFRNARATAYDLAVRFRGVDAQPVTAYSATPGEAPSGSFHVTNRYDTRFSGGVAGSLFGFRRTRKVDVTGETFTESLSLDREIGRLDLELTLDPRTYNRFTDIAVSVLDGSGKAVVKSGFSNGTARITVDNAGRAESRHTLEVRGAMARSSDDPWKLEIRETYVRADPIAVDVGHTVLYPQVRQRLTYRLSATPPRPPGGFVNYGEIDFVDDERKESWLKLPMELK